jgi:hypothetical protein
MTVMAGSASAFSVDGDYSDWFTGYVGNVSNSNWIQGGYTLTNTSIREIADEEGPLPGYGGQAYDIEDVFYAYQDNDPNAVSGGTLFIGLVTGFPPDGHPLDGYYAGDLFVGLGGSGSLNLAIGVGTDAATSVGRYEQAWQINGASDVISPSPYTSSSPYRASATATNITGSVNPDVAWGTHGVHYFLETSIDLDAAGEILVTDPTQSGSGGLSLHWTMGCGNDVIDVNDSTPLVPVPEPSTIILLGMGVLGIALRSRHPRC